MGLKYHTIIVVPHARARFRKLRLSNRQLATAVGLVLFLAVLSIFSTWSFLTNSIDRQELAQIRKENEELRQVNQSFESSIRQLAIQLTEFEDRTRKLAIVAGLDSLNVSTEPGIGGEDYAGSTTASEQGLDELSSWLNDLEGNLDSVSDSLEERDLRVASTPAVAPVKGVLTSGYGYRSDPFTGKRVSHPAIDISTSPGRPVKASADGIIVRAGRIGNLGNAIYISHGYGVSTRYGHLSKIDVEPGQRVKQGDVIGAVGRTGRATGNHLHYQVIQDGKSVNPLQFILDGTSPSPSS